MEGVCPSRGTVGGRRVGQWAATGNRTGREKLNESFPHTSVLCLILLRSFRMTYILEKK